LTKLYSNCQSLKRFVEGLTKSIRKAMLLWLVTANQIKSREKRIKQIVKQAGKTNSKVFKIKNR